MIKLLDLILGFIDTRLIEPCFQSATQAWSVLTERRRAAIFILSAVLLVWLIVTYEAYTRREARIMANYDQLRVQQIIDKDAAEKSVNDLIMQNNKRQFKTR